MAPRRIAVIGAGIIGLSTALRILQEVPQAEVTVFAEFVSPSTTSDVAAGFWGPAHLSNTPRELVVSWGQETFEFLSRLARTDPQSPTYGVFLSPGFDLHRVENPEVSHWSHIPIGFRAATPQELAMFPSTVKSAFYFVNAVVEGSKFLPHLSARLKSLGAELVENRRVESFSEIHELGYRHIVNCTGLGAMKLCSDSLMYPIRGQVHRVHAPWLKFWFESDDGAYCLLNGTNAVLGGVSQPNSWDTTVSEKDKASILSRNYAIWPALKAAPVVADQVGLRPARDTVRLEREVTRASPGGEEFTIYHNYGHGGSGLTLFWGCAGDVVKLLRQDLRGCDGKL